MDRVRRSRTTCLPLRLISHTHATRRDTARVALRTKGTAVVKTLSLARRPGRAVARQRIGAILLLVIVAAAAIGTERLMREPDFVARVTVQNPTDYLVDVRIDDAHGDGWVELAVLEPHITVGTREVLDQGDVWRFELSAGGVNGAVLRRTRAQLERSHWRLVIPTSVVQRFEQARVPPAPQARL